MKWSALWVFVVLLLFVLILLLIFLFLINAFEQNLFFCLVVIVYQPFIANFFITYSNLLSLLWDAKLFCQFVLMNSLFLVSGRWHEWFLVFSWCVVSDPKTPLQNYFFCFFLTVYFLKKGIISGLLIDVIIAIMIIIF